MPKTYLVKVGTTELDKYLKNVTVERNKLWTEADRNLNGDLRATFIGMFPKIILEFGYLTETELKSILTVIEPISFTVSWWDSKAENYQTGTFYSGDYGYPVYDKKRELYEPFRVSLISYNKL